MKQNTYTKRRTKTGTGYYSHKDTGNSSHCLCVFCEAKYAQRYSNLRDWSSANKNEHAK